MTTPSSPKPLPVVAWLYTHKISGASAASDWRWPATNAARECHVEAHLVRLSDAQASIQALEAEVAALNAEIGLLKLQLEAGPLYSTRLKAKRYDLLRRGQHWSVIDGIGNTLRAEALDAAIDAARAAQEVKP